MLAPTEIPVCIDFRLCPGDCHGPVGPRNDTETGNPGRTDGEFSIVNCQLSIDLRQVAGGFVTRPTFIAENLYFQTRSGKNYTNSPFTPLA